MVGLTVAACCVAAVVALVGFSGAVRGNDAAYAMGAAVGGLIVTGGIALLIGWGNGRRARIAFIVVGILVILSNVASAAAL